MFLIKKHIILGLSIPSNPDSMITTMSGHHYHYPNLDSSIGNSTLGRPHLIRVGSSGRLRLAQHMIDPRLVPPSTAALIDPMMLGPYDNGTLEGNDSENTVDEFVARGSVLGPLRNGIIRRINSFESLHQLPRGRKCILLITKFFVPFFKRYRFSLSVDFFL